MAQLQVVIAPDDRLRTECEPIDEITPEIRQLALDMADTMYATGGCGIAAPQVGVCKQLVVIDCEWDGEDGPRDPQFLINPQIMEQSDEKKLGSEGCLSVPGVSFDIERSTSITVRARDLDGRLMQYEAAGNLFCVCLQHEIDHLNGITMLERLKPAERLRGMREYHAALAAGARPGETE